MVSSPLVAGCAQAKRESAGSLSLSCGRALRSDPVELLMIARVQSDLNCGQHLPCDLGVSLGWLEAGEAKAEARGVADVHLEVRLASVDPPEGLGGDGRIGGHAAL